MTFNHDYYNKNFDDGMENSTFDDIGDMDTENLIIQDEKCGDELLIDLVRSRPFLYNKKLKEYKDNNMKENAWTEISSILEMSVSDCQTRWVRLRQRFSKERQLRENETRSGAGKPTRPKWVLFDNLSFLESVVVHRRTYSNVANRKVDSSASSQTFNQNSAQSETQDDEIYGSNIDNMELHSVTGLIDSDNSEFEIQSELSSSLPPVTVPMQLRQQSTSSSTLRSTPSPIQRSTPSPMQRSTSSPIRPSSAPLPKRSVSEAEESSTFARALNVPSSCFTETSNKLTKKSKIDPMETAFLQMNTTLSTMASKVLQNRDDDVHDPDVMIGKLVTAELKKTMEPMKSNLKRKFMELLYSHCNE